MNILNPVHVLIKYIILLKCYLIRIISSNIFYCLAIFRIACILNYHFFYFCILRSRLLSLNFYEPTAEILRRKTKIYVRDRMVDCVDLCHGPAPDFFFCVCRHDEHVFWSKTELLSKNHRRQKESGRNNSDFFLCNSFSNEMGVCYYLLATGKANSVTQCSFFYHSPQEGTDMQQKKRLVSEVWKCFLVRLIRKTHYSQPSATLIRD